MSSRILAWTSEDDARAAASAAASLGHDLTSVVTADALFGALRDGRYDVTLVSLSHEHVDEAVLERIGSAGAAGALLLSARGISLDAALLAERLGAMALLREPLKAEALEGQLEALADEGPSVELPPPPDDADAGASSLVGESAQMAEVFRMIARVARSSATVLITGESGTGKEVVARTLHERGDRSTEPFVAVNCAAIPEHLLESELFGHEKGAFTGAVARRAGRFQRADGGTLFLDEIGDMSLVLQAKVLRVLEDRRVERVGGQAAEAVDVRVVAATNQRLRDAIEDGRFREDLYYRLAVVEIELPPLRHREGDVRRLALHFASLLARRHGRPIRQVTSEALARLERAEWPGNVRELRNVLDRAVLLTPDDTIRSGALRLGAAAPHGSSRTEASAPVGYPSTASLAQVEADHIRRVLASVSGHIGNASEILGIHRNTLSRKIQEYELDGGGSGP